MKKGNIIKAFTILALAALVILIPSVLLSCKPEGGFFGEEEDDLITYQVSRGNIIQSVSTSGNIESRYSTSYSLKT